MKVKHITETSVLAKGEFLAAMNHQIRTPPK
ncbi:histidine kinase [Xylella fastidiosa]|uniref:Histidine kinase n=1 Tax=Xylella fastidiosa TaxID=2371 RepID=A0ABD7BXZ1_XYLFS|nr:histidine kinase [Xylella fastidiosa]QPB73038.1 histidine kinase [Xylella fastidiosa]QPB73347.1 histidine kinase [Xylella fastidiosa]